jgi:hypothetical protein
MKHRYLPANSLPHDVWLDCPRVRETITARRPEKSYSPFFRLFLFPNLADYFYMDHYSCETSVELTALGWLYLAEKSLQKSSKAETRRAQAEGKRKAGIPLVSAIRAIESQARTGECRFVG